LVLLQEYITTHGSLNVKFRIESSLVADSHICNDRYSHEM